MQEDRNSAFPSRGPLSRTQKSSCSTRPPPRSTLSPSEPCRRRCGPPCAAAPISSLPTGSRPSKMLTALPLWAKGASSSRELTVISSTSEEISSDCSRPRTWLSMMMRPPRMRVDWSGSALRLAAWTRRLLRVAPGRVKLTMKMTRRPSDSSPDSAIKTCLRYLPAYCFPSSWVVQTLPNQ